MVLPVATVALTAITIVGLTTSGPSHANPSSPLTPTPPTSATESASLRHDFYLVGASSTAGASVSTAPGVVSASTVPAASALAADGIPTVASAAYLTAAAWSNVRTPACRLTWPLLAAIGRIESDHGRAGGAVLRVDGTSSPKIIGAPLNGVGAAPVAATAYGASLHGDHVYEHAVGPMQFLPATWLSYGVAASGAGPADPFNINDAAVAAARYVCAAGGDLGTVSGQQRAAFAYNHSDAYVTAVLALEAAYAAAAGIVTIAGPAPTAAPPATLVPSVVPGSPASATGSATASVSPSSGPTPRPSPSPSPSSCGSSPTGSPSPTPTNSESVSASPTATVAC